jgi:hypothetical protein
VAILVLSVGVVTVVLLKDAVGEAGTPRLTTSALRDVSVRQGRTAVFRYRVHGAATARTDVEIRIGSAATGVIMTVHLGRRPMDADVSQRLRIDLDPGRYVWSVAATDSLGAVRSTASVAELTVSADRSD